MLRVAVAGLGGFAGSHHAALLALEERGVCQVVATCDPNAGTMAAETERFRLGERRIAILPDLDAMLELKPNVVTLPTPIPLHAAQHHAVISAGAACYLEKPPSLWWPEFEEMVSHDRLARFRTQVGFNFVGDPFRLALKARIATGELGRLKGATFQAVWPRGDAYYGRNGWAGRLVAGGRPVLDSPIGNAMAHYVQNLLFWCDSDVKSVRGCLFRAHPVESFDTAFVSARFTNGTWLRIAATHCGTTTFDEEVVFFDKARIVFESWRQARIEWSDGNVERLESGVADQGLMLQANLMDYFDYVQGTTGGPTTSLEDSLRFVLLNDLALVSSGGIDTYPSSRVTVDSAGHRIVQGLDLDMKAFADEGKWPARESEEVGVDDIHRLSETLEKLR